MCNGVYTLKLQLVMDWKHLPIRFDWPGPAVALSGCHFLWMELFCVIMYDSKWVAAVFLGRRYSSTSSTGRLLIGDVVDLTLANPRLLRTLNDTFKSCLAVAYIHYMDARDNDDGILGNLLPCWLYRLSPFFVRNDASSLASAIYSLICCMENRGRRLFWE